MRRGRHVKIAPRNGGGYRDIVEQLREALAGVSETWGAA
jgi:hypothetical protein